MQEPGTVRRNTVGKWYKDSSRGVTAGGLVTSLHPRCSSSQTLHEWWPLDDNIENLQFSTKEEKCPFKGHAMSH